MDQLNLTEEQLARVSMIARGLEAEFCLRNLLDELLWASIDVSRMLRPGGYTDPKKRELVSERLAKLRLKTELVRNSDWVNLQSLAKVYGGELISLEDQVVRRKRQKAERRTG